jgi:hypothetical protein
MASVSAVAQNTKLIEQVRPFLPAGETFQAAIPAQAGLNPWFVNSIGASVTGLLGFLITSIFRVKHRIIVVTDQRPTRAMRRPPCWPGWSAVRRSAR